MRTGDEPTHARSPLRARLALALLGFVSAALVGALFAAFGHPGVGAAFFGIAAVAVVNTAVVLRHIHEGPHFQPGRDVPPYHPAPRERDDSARMAATGHDIPLPVRRRRYFILMGICLTLIVVAWGLVQFVSQTAAMVMTLVAAVIPPIAAIAANAGRPLNH